MRVLIIGHAYAASYNRRDKLARIAEDSRVEQLGVIVPNNWHDRMMKLDRFFEEIPEDKTYRVFLLKAFLRGVQSKYLYSPLALNQVVADFKPDVIHVEQELHDWLLSEVLFLNQVFWQKPVAVFVWENLRRRYNPLSAVLRKYSLSRISYLIGGNQEAIEIAQQDGFRHNATITPQFGVDEERFKPIGVADLRSDLGLDRKFVIGFAARFVEEKGFSTFVKAIEILLRKNRVADFRVVFLSSMQPPNWLKEKSTNLQERFIFLENVPHEDFAKYMNLFDVLVLPSETQTDWKEQFGRVMIEAMACGVPVIGSNSGAIPEVVGEYGIIFREKDAEHLAEAIASVMKNPQVLDELKSRVRDYVLANYTHKRVADQNIQAWEQMHSSQNKAT